MVGIAEVRGGSPRAGGEPSPYRFSQRVCGSGEFDGEDRTVSAHRAGDVDDALVLAVAAMPTSDQLAGMVGIGVELSDSEIGALVCGLLARGGIVAAWRAGSCRSSAVSWADATSAPDSGGEASDVRVVAAESISALAVVGVARWP